VHDIPELDTRGLRRFALVTSTLVVVLFGLAFPWLFDAGYPMWPWILGLGLSVWGIVAADSLRPVYRGWMKFGLLLNRITTPIILGIVFFVVILPIGLAIRLKGRDPMARSFDENAKTYRVSSTKPTKKSMERPF